ncbi:MAG: hypothetical protein JNL94_12170 [Planctomycetes bacterium]|nr:hypothetical protein [Planctomycetota bacterium]
MLSFLASIVSVALGVTGSGSLHVHSGFSGSTMPIAAASAFVGGLAPLPGGHLAVFDGSRVVEIDPASNGAVVRVLHTPPTFVFGSFLALDPTASFLVFGESSNGTLTRIPLDGSPTSLVAHVSFNYDGVFDASGALYVAHGNPTWTGTDLVRVDVATGGVQTVATVSGPSGPVAFDSSGTLLYGVNSPFFPAPPGSGSLIAFTASQLAGATGSGVLTDGDALVLVTGLDAIGDLVVDAEGDLIVGDSIHGTVTAYDATGVVDWVIASPAAASTSVTYLAFVDDGSSHAATFDPYQPNGGGTLALVVSDFATTNDVVLVHPERPTFTVAPSNPVPVGSFTVTLEDAPAHGLAMLFAAAASSSNEAIALVGDVPLFFALLPPTLVHLGVVPLDATGAASLPASNPGIGATIAIQAVVFDATLTPRGTSQALDLGLQ